LKSIAAISKALGHANIATTANIYAHATEAIQERTAYRVDDLMTGRRRASGA
jgi:hypothetical protein